jgi:hypothetical protein
LKPRSFASVCSVERLKLPYAKLSAALAGAAQRNSAEGAEGGEGMKGYHYNNVQKQNISKAKIGQKYPKEHGKKISQARLGQKHSEETINKISKTKALKHNIIINTSLKDKIKSNSQKCILQYDLDNNHIQEYKSAQEAGRCINKSGNQIADCASGRQKTAYGYIWKYKI